MLKCSEIIEFLDDYVDGTQPPGVRTHFETHLAVCPPCVDYLNTYRVTIRLGKAALCGEHDRLLPDVPEELIQAILASRAK